MAIYHLNVSSIGRSTQQSGTAGAHARYIARPDAASAVEAHVMPANGNYARAWLNREEDQGRKNGRVITKIRVALPRELSHGENVDAVREFVSQLTGENRVPWMFAIHDKEGNDRQNPHAHIIIRDQDIKTGKQVCKFSASKIDREKAGLDPNPVTHARELWQEVGNRHLERAGQEPVLDSRTLQAQNVDRKATIHEGPRAQAVEKKGDRPESQNREIPIVYNPESLPSEYVNDNGQSRDLRYDLIDQGRTRSEYNQEIRAENQHRARISEASRDAVDAFMVAQAAPDKEVSSMTDSPEIARQRLEDAQKKLSRDEAERVAKAEKTASQHRAINTAKENKQRVMAERREAEGITPEFNEQTPDLVRQRSKQLLEKVRQDKAANERISPKFNAAADEPRKSKPEERAPEWIRETDPPDSPNSPGKKQDVERDRKALMEERSQQHLEKLRLDKEREKERERDRGDPER